MRAMLFPDQSFKGRSLLWAMAVSLLIHGLALFMPQRDAPDKRAPPLRLEASLAPRAPPLAPAAAPELTAPLPAPLPAQRQEAKPPRRSRIIRAPERRQWSAAETAEMKNFLDELGVQARVRPKPTLAQRSLADAREYGRQLAQQDATERLTLEPRPNAPPPDAFSLEMYVDGLLKRLNRSASLVRKDPRSNGVRAAAVQFRLNPDGSLKSFVVLNAADRAEEIDFIKSVIERSLPFAAFPPDINRAARSLAMTICILPARESGFGFSRATAGRGC